MNATHPTNRGPGLSAPAGILQTLRVAVLGVAVLLAAGCSTTPKTTDMLAAAGFKIVPATTPEQQAQLRKLSTKKLSMVQRGGKEYFVFPDLANKVLYVGQNPQYQQYQALKLNERDMKEAEDIAGVNAGAAELNAGAAAMEAGGAWGGWGGWGEW